MARPWVEVAPRFEQRHNPSQGSMGAWGEAAPAYRYGWEAAGWVRYAGRPWREVAIDLERGWDDYQRSIGRRVLTEWEGFKKAVEEGYSAAAAEVRVAAPASAPVEPERLVRDFLEAYNSKGKASLDTIMGSLAPDAEVSFTPLVGSVRGERNLRAAFTGLFADEAGTQIVLGEVSGGPDRLVAEWTERGRNYRTAEDVLRKVAGIFDIAGGKIVALRMYPVRLR